MSFSINHNPNGKFVVYYREAKILTLQIMLNVSFINKAEAGARLDYVNRCLQLCRQNPKFDISVGAHNAREIDASIEVIRSAYLRASRSSAPA